MPYQEGGVHPIDSPVSIGQAAELSPPIIATGSRYEMHSIDGYTGAEINHWILTFNGMVNGNCEFNAVDKDGAYLRQMNKDYNRVKRIKRQGPILCTKC